MSSSCKPPRVAILDAGAQYSKIIDRRIRELQVESEILPLSTSIDGLHHFSGIIISGGPQSVYGAEAPKYDPRLFELDVPILGICYGMQLLNHACHGRVERGGVREDGQFSISLVANSSGHSESLLYAGLPSEIEVLLTHGDSVIEPAPGFIATSHSPHGIIASIEDPKRKYYGVQYHPEVDLTPEGQTIFLNFLEAVCRISRTFTLRSRQQSAIDEIRAAVGSTSQVLCLLSGGVDSSVCAALLKEAIGAERIIAVHINNGFMRKVCDENESESVVRALEHIGLKIHLVDARERFYQGRTDINGEATPPLNTVTSPEVKRKIIGDVFMRVSEEELRKLGLNPSEVYLAQGTLRPDLIESASALASSGGHADVIKTHHNDTALVRALRESGRIIEPLKTLHKDEVRQLGLELGLPSHLIWRQPFPGPGLAVRIICATQPYVTGEEEKIKEALERYVTPDINVSLLACRTVGVQGDSRSYSSLVALSSRRQPAAHDLSPNWHSLFHLAKTIPRTVHGVNRVVYVFGEPLTQREYRTITPTLLNEECIQQLQAADDIVNQTLLKYGLIKTLSQVPVILFPIDFQQPSDADSADASSSVSNVGKRSICIRTFVTNDFMTGVPAIPVIDEQHTKAEAAASPSPSPTPSLDSFTSSSSSSFAAPTTHSKPNDALDILTVPIPSRPSLSSPRFPTMPLVALQEMVTLILEKVPGIARVCFDLTSKPPATTEWE